MSIWTTAAMRAGTGSSSTAPAPVSPRPGGSCGVPGELDNHRQVAPRAVTLDQWLEYWMEQVILPNRAETTVYGYRKIIENHLSDALGTSPYRS